MLIKDAVYSKCKTCKRTDKRLSEEVYGCDQCRKEINLESHAFLEICVFYNDKGAEHFQLCSWNCVFKFLPKVKTDYFVSLPYLHFEENTAPGQGISDFLAEVNLLKKKRRRKNGVHRRRK